MLRPGLLSGGHSHQTPASSLNTVRHPRTPRLMPLHCGLHALNALVAVDGGRPFRVSDLDRLTEWVHRRERTVCPEGVDTAPQPDGNYPLETLLVALRQRRYAPEFRRGRGGEGASPPGRLLGYLVGTGRHCPGCHPNQPRMTADPTSLWSRDRRSGWSWTTATQRIGRPIPRPCWTAWGIAWPSCSASSSDGWPRPHTPRRKRRKTTWRPCVGTHGTTCR